MKKKSLWQMLLVGIAMFTVGCGAFPGALVDVAKNSAKDAIVENIDETIDGLIGSLVDLDNLPLPFDVDEEGP